ncbi:hypothetical protein MNEG_5750 [Monoraphidium neglectum]|uniref:Uncharacterized protein n=1 Tax=Monoraphidium neglectum TaxID=145388 RepID=A0A0D2JTI4_9CHLO|nr:hypothetical protein MNEG_5750 [Monoraphidium neglectum]KIZ02203.1 hypothetical protein MNEG_5750 [Monoraphidium neglectum]|eukprot:XP_013901222.1 hypothetical protein MNEG_5750 [Monoraphidium neglectum]
MAHAGIGRSGQQLVARPPAADSPIRSLLCGTGACSGRGGGARDSTQAAADRAYEAALELSRQQQHGAAREAFEELLRAHPNMCKAWVSYAQMEKRIGRLGDPQRLHIARFVLQRGLSSNPDSACLAQAWGLLELQR